MENTAKPIKKRGTIVTDMCELMALAVAYDPNTLASNSELAALTPKTGTYLDLLAVLGNHDYQIVIPETVMLKAVGMLVGKGKAIELYGPLRERKSTIPILQAIAEFCKEAARGAYPGVSVQAGKVECEQASARKPYEHYLADYRNMSVVLADKPHAVRLSRLKKLNESYENRSEGFCAQHCIDVIVGQLHAQADGPDKDLPVFLLSGNALACTELQERLVRDGLLPEGGKAPVSQLTTLGLLMGLQRDELWKKMGLAGKAIEEHRASIGRNAIARSCITCHDRQLTGCRGGQGVPPFSETTIGLAEEIAQINAVEAPSKAVEAEEQSGAGQVARFAARFANWKPVTAGKC